MSEEDRSESPTAPIPSGSGSHPGWTPTLKPGEELLTPAEQQKLLKRRARDHERYWRQKEQKRAASKAAEEAQMEAAPDVDAMEVEPLPRVSETQPVTAKDSDDESSSEDEDEKLHCLCQTIYDGERIMVCCDRCDGWYHPECVKMKETDVKLVDMFICPKCSKNTPDRTTWKTACLRTSCTEPANPPLSRYCSDRCGILVAATKIAKTKYASSKNSADGIERLFVRQVKAARKREGMVVWQSSSTTDTPIADIWFQQLQWDEDSHATGSAMPAPQPTTLNSASSQEDENLHQLQCELETFLTRKSKHSAALDLVMARQKLLQLTEDRVLPPVVVSLEESTAKKSKGRGGAAKADDQMRSQPRCGYDERLSWDDEKFTDWMTSTHGAQVLSEEVDLDGRLHDEPPAEGDHSIPTICGLAKRKCKRHSDWSTIRGMEFEFEKDFQTARLSRCSEQESHLRSQIQEIEATLRARRTAEDARLALDLAQGAAARRRGVV